VTVLQGVPVDRITTEARQVSFGRTMLTIIAAVLYGAGWLVAKVASVVWLAAAWCATAVKIGWTEGRGARGEGG
jgi:hypothetical protein